MITADDVAPGWFVLEVAADDCPGLGQSHSGLAGQVGEAVRSLAIAAALAAMSVPSAWEGWACEVCGHQVVLVDGDVRRRKRGRR